VLLVKHLVISNLRRSRSQWPRGLKHELSSLARTLGSWVWIPLKGWIFYARLFCVCFVLCVGRGLATDWSPVQTVYRLCIGLNNWKSGQDPTKGCKSRNVWHGISYQDNYYWQNLSLFLRMRLMWNVFTIIRTNSCLCWKKKVTVRDCWYLTWRRDWCHCMLLKGSLLIAFLDGAKDHHDLWASHHPLYFRVGVFKKSLFE
jgi:hypothetical protein